jgi:hypothetical protein
MCARRTVRSEDYGAGWRVNWNRQPARSLGRPCANRNNVQTELGIVKKFSDSRIIIWAEEWKSSHIEFQVETASKIVMEAEWENMLVVGRKEARADPRGLQGLPYRTAQLLEKRNSEELLGGCERTETDRSRVTRLSTCTRVFVS